MCNVNSNANTIILGEGSYSNVSWMFLSPNEETILTPDFGGT